MPPPFSSAAARKPLVELLLYAAVALSATALTWWLLDLWNMTLAIPLEYGRFGDAKAVEAGVKMIAENAGFNLYTNPRLNFPNGYAAFDYPATEIIPAFLLWLAAKCITGFGAALNLYYLATFPAVAVAGAAVFRVLGMSRSSAFVVALLYTFLPFHFYRGEMHLTYAAYWFVPLATLLIWWLATGVPLVRRGRLPLTRRGVTALALAALIGYSGIYHVAFTGGLIIVAALVRLAKTSRWTTLLPPAVASAIIFAACITTLIPTILYHRSHPTNAAATLREPIEAEQFSLRLAQLVMPSSYHRLPFLAEPRMQYSETFPNVNENDYATLGVVGVIGLELIAWHALRALCRRPHDRRLTPMFTLVFAAVAVASAGGLGTVFALFVNAQIRSMNRISIYIAFLCLAAVGLRLDRWLASPRLRHPAWRVAILCGVLAVGLFDQTSPVWVPHYAQQRALWKSDADFVHRIEQTLPRGSAVFQLPISPLPQGGVGQIAYSEEFIGFEHSDKLKWSHGFFIGPQVYEYLELIKKINDLPDQLRRRGFSGIYIDRRGGVSESAVRYIVVAAGGVHFESANRALVFVALRP